jgi:hypothetical protein
VDESWICCARIVTSKLFSIGFRANSRHRPVKVQLRTAFRLRRRCTSLESCVGHTDIHYAKPRQPVNVVRINETIAGRAYTIEVLAVGRDRWRAQIARHGTGTALMPFYGATPDEAARLLTAWLAKANAKPTADRPGKVR